MDVRHGSLPRTALLVVGFFCACALLYRRAQVTDLVAPPSESSAPTKVIFTEDIASAYGARCLDRSPAGYYIREQDPTRWVVYLQGGGLCVEMVDCVKRSHQALGSSTKWPAEWAPHESPIFSTAPDAYFQNFSQVYIPYCSGDMWLGTDRKTRVATGGLQMSGHLILEAVLAHLANVTKFQSAATVYFTGSSAGGVGVIQHSDWFQLQLPGQKVFLLPSAGMFFPHRWPVLFQEFVLGITKPVGSFFAKWCHLLEGGFLHAGCLKAAQERGAANGTCFDVSNVLPHVNGDIFIINAQFDALQIHDLGLCMPEECYQDADSGSLGGRFIRLFGERLNDTLHTLIRSKPHVGVYLPAWFDHDYWLQEEMAGRGPALGGMSLKEAITAWSEKGQDVHIFGASCNKSGPCALPVASVERSADMSVFAADVRRSVTSSSSIPATPVVV